MSLSIREAAREAPDAIALVENGRSHTFAEIARRVEARAPSGDRVVAVDGRDLETAISFYAALEARLPFLPIHAALTAAERERLAPSTLEIPRYDGEEAIAAVIYTSGTTGAPKAALLSRRALAAHARASAEAVPFARGDRWLACLPLAHVGGLMILVRALAARSTAVLAPRFDPSIDATHVSVVPAQLARWLDEGVRTRPKVVLVGGAACPPSLARRAIDAGLPVRLTWGCTEACSQIATWRDPADAGSGRPLPGLEVRTEDDRLLVRGESLFSGYAGGPPHDGWHDTGDVGFVDAHGCVHVLGRRDDRIVTGGEKVDPVEVEHELAAAGVPACVFGIADDRFGQIVAATVATAEPIHALERICAERLAAHKRPRRWFVVDSLPLLPSGKLDRRAAARLALAAR